MKSLGNKHIETRTGPRIQIADPKAAEELLDAAIELARRKQRLIFFCGCQWPRCGGKIACHRTTVAGLVLKAAAKRGIQVEVVEWPSGGPNRIELEVTDKEFAAIRKGRMTLPLGKRVDLAGGSTGHARPRTKFAGDAQKMPAFTGNTIALVAVLSPG
jgi:hypothetical protein